MYMKTLIGSHVTGTKDTTTWLSVTHEQKQIHTHANLLLIECIYKVKQSHNTLCSFHMYFFSCAQTGFK